MYIKKEFAVLEKAARNAKNKKTLKVVTSIGNRRVKNILHSPYTSDKIKSEAKKCKIVLKKIVSRKNKELSN